MMQNPYDIVSNENFGYVCQDCKYFGTKCSQQDDGGCICSRFKLPSTDEDAVFDEEVE